MFQVPAITEIFNSPYRVLELSLPLGTNPLIKLRCITKGYMFFVNSKAESLELRLLWLLARSTVATRAGVPGCSPAILKQVNDCPSADS
jgi:hypothetical protein